MISLGYRDSMTLEQVGIAHISFCSSRPEKVKTCLEMDSNEERIAKASEEARIKEANAAANAKGGQL